MTYPHGPGPQGPGQQQPGGYDPNQGYQQPPAPPESGTSYSLDLPGQPGVDPYSAPPAQDQWSQSDPYAAAPQSGQPYAVAPQSGQPDPYAQQQYAQQPGYPTTQPGYPGAWPQGAPMAPAPKKGMSGGLIAVIAAVTLLVLVIVGGGIGYAVVNRDKDKDPVATQSSKPPEEPKEDGGAEDLVLEESAAADKLYPARFDKLASYPAYKRIAYGKVSCEDSTDSEDLRDILDDVGCKEVLVGVYVDEDTEAVVTVGYIKTDSAATAERKYKDIKEYSKRTQRPKLMAPKESKIDKGYQAYYYTDYVDDYITYALTAWYDGHDPDTVDSGLIQHGVVVATQVERKGERD